MVAGRRRIDCRRESYLHCAGDGLASRCTLPSRTRAADVPGGTSPPVHGNTIWLTDGDTLDPVDLIVCLLVFFLRARLIPTQILYRQITSSRLKGGAEKWRRRIKTMRDRRAGGYQKVSKEEKKREADIRKVVGGWWMAS